MSMQGEEKSGISLSYSLKFTHNSYDTSGIIFLRARIQ